MADSQNIGTRNVNYPTDYNLKTLNLITPLQPSGVNLMPFMVELNLFEDLYGSTISGEVILQDSLGLISSYGLNGTEFIQIQLQKSSTDTDFYSRNFRVYRIGERVVGDNNDYEVFSLLFCSEEFMLSEQYRISKSFKGQQISTIIATIMNVYLKTQKQVTIEPTLGNYDFVLPNKKLFETINWLTTYAQSQSSPGDYVFFENSSGYYFMTLAKLYQQNVYGNYKFDPKNIANDLNQQVNNVTDFEVLNFYDNLAAVTNGTFANKVITFNVLQRKKDSSTGVFNYSKYLSTKPSSLNSGPITNDYVNRLGATMYNMPPVSISGLETGCLRLSSSNGGDKLSSGIQAKKAVDSVANDIMTEKYLPNRVGKLALINYTKIKVTIPGDPNICIGKVVNFNTYRIEPSVFSQGQNNATRTPDPLYSGKYLVTAVRHVVKNNSYITIMEMAKESNSGSIAQFTNNSNMSDVVKGVQI